MSAFRDPYFSRTQSAWSFGERLDPVVTPGIPGPLSAQELSTYERDGFLVKQGLFSDAEVALLLEAAGALVQQADRRQDDVITEPGSQAIRSLFRVHRHEGAFGALWRQPRLLGVAQQILGSKAYIHQSRINFKPAFEGKSFPWHSDFETWHIEDGMPRMRAVTACMLLTDNVEHNGPLLVVPGSHQHFVRCVGETPADHFHSSLRKQQYGVPDPDALRELVQKRTIQSVTGVRGSVVFFDCNLMHGSGGNITPWSRQNVFYVFNSVDNRLVAPFGNRPPRPNFLAERDGHSSTG